jgi:hypothetical protein
VSLLVSAAFAVLVAVQVDVRSATNCPSTEDIVTRLVSLLPLPDAVRVGGRDVATVQLLAVREDGGTEIRIELSSARGVRIGERSVSSRGTCTQMAEVVAAVLAAWESDPTPSSAATEAPPPVPEPRPTLVARLSSAPPVSRREYRGAIGVGGGVALLGGVAGALKLAGEFGSVASHWQLALDASTESSRTIALAGGRVDWRHSTAGLALGWRSLGAKVVFSVDAGAVLGWARLAGYGYPTANGTHESFEYGLSGGLRLGRTFGGTQRWQVWAEVRPRWWLQGQRARVANSPLTAEVPALELMAHVGASVVAFP